MPPPRGKRTISLLLLYFTVVFLKKTVLKTYNTFRVTAIELLHIECVLLYPVSQIVSPQNCGFTRAKLTRPRIFCYKNYVRYIQNGGCIRAKSWPLIRHQARILYLLIVWSGLTVAALWHVKKSGVMFWMKPAVNHIRYGYIIIPQNNTLACSSETPHWRVLLTRRVFYHSSNTFSVCCNDFLTCCWVFWRVVWIWCVVTTLNTTLSWLLKAKFLEHVSVSYKHVCVLKQHANNTSRFLV